MYYPFNNTLYYIKRFVHTSSGIKRVTPLHRIRNEQIREEIAIEPALKRIQDTQLM